MPLRSSSKNIRVGLCSFLVAVIIGIFSAYPAAANNLTISNVHMGARNPSTQTVVISFDVSWENAWHTKINHDAAWLTVRLNDPAVSPTDRKLVLLTASGLNPAGTSTNGNSLVELYVPADRAGVFLRPATYGKFSEVAVSTIEVTVDYASAGFTNADEVYATVFGLEMVYVPEGAFYAGDGSTSTASFVSGSGDTDSWYVVNGDAIAVSNPEADGYRYVSAGNPGENATGSSFSIPAAFPNGYEAFYVMKYEVTEGQWVEFVNSLPSSASREQRDITDAAHKNGDTVRSRNTVSCSGMPLVCATERPSRAVGYLSWMDLAAFLDWVALRPMTELEYEKMARGPVVARGGEYAWGTTAITAAGALSGASETGTESVITIGANANFDAMVLTGGDTANGVEYQSGPLRAGIFATSSSNREIAGAGYYGVLDLSGNLRERVVSVGLAAGRLFTATHGDGALSSAEGYAGNADQSDWPGFDAIEGRGVTGADGSGFRGGSWSTLSDRLRISDRNEAAVIDASAYRDAGGRGVRNGE